MRICHYALSSHWFFLLIMYSYSIFIPELKADTGCLNWIMNAWIRWKPSLGRSGNNALLIFSTACSKAIAWKSDSRDPSLEYSQLFTHRLVAIWTCPLAVWILCIFVPLFHGDNGTQGSFRVRRRWKWPPSWCRSSPIRTDHSL